MIIQAKYKIITEGTIFIFKYVKYEISNYHGQLDVETLDSDGNFLLKERVDFLGEEDKYCVTNISYRNNVNKSATYAYMRNEPFSNNEEIDNSYTFFNKPVYDNTQLLILLPYISIINKDLFVFIPTSNTIIPIIVKSYEEQNKMIYKILSPELAIAEFNKESLILENYYSRKVRMENCGIS